MSKEEILSAIQSCAQKLGRVPTRRELQKMNGVSHREVDRRFGSYGRAVTLAGMDPERKHKYGIGREPLLEDWARVARALGKAPTRFEYVAEGRFSTTPFERHWKHWGKVREDFVRFAKEAGQEGVWEDVLSLPEMPRLPKIAGIEKQISPQMNADEMDRKSAGIEKHVLPQTSTEGADQKIAGSEESPRFAVIARDRRDRRENLTAD